MSLFEKTFWITIAIFLVLYIIAQMISHSFLKADELGCKIDRVPKSLIHNFPNQKVAKLIVDNYNDSIKSLNHTISKDFNGLFKPVIQRQIDGYLDKYYSVKGDYEELWNGVKGGVAKAMGKEEKAQKIAEKMAEQLLGDDFEEKFSVIKENINEVYTAQVRGAFNKMAYKMASTNENGINQKMLASMTKISKENLKEAFDRGATATSIIVAAGGITAIKLVSKLLLKFTSKIITKGVSNWFVTGASGLVGGAIGKFMFGSWGVVLGSVGGAVAAWLMTDKVALMIDEHFNRKDKKKELVEKINQYKSHLTCLYQQTYSKLLVQNATKLAKRLKQVE